MFNGVLRETSIELWSSITNATESIVCIGSRINSLRSLQTYPNCELYVPVGYLTLEIRIHEMISRCPVIF